MNIGIDVDGVLGDLIGGLIIVANERHGLALTSEDYDDWGFFQDNFEFSTSHVLNMMDEAWERGLVELIEPGSAKWIHDLKSQGHDITIITRRTYKSHPAVTAWLHKQGIKYTVLIFNGPGIEKLDYPIDVLIDDAPTIAEKAKKHPEKSVYLLDRVWNAHVDTHQPPFNVSRVKSLEQALKFLRRFSGK
ncbi:hypothetical protein LCGC14_0264670 [marine sediment metagenome]|uniref:Nucleotidase n=1 Tax=marine sediment metagenome TaxID=412755 RepID=A0A0F9U5M5_9ZZZZ